MSIIASKLVLGTAQWGMKYGVSNSQGQTSADEVRKILATASSVGISLLDTAPLYGQAEQTLGQSDLSRFRVITKTPKFRKDNISTSDADYLVQTFYTSLERLGLNSVHALLIHSVDDIFTPNASRLISALQLLKSEGLISKIGVSVYNSSQIYKALDLFLPDIIQLPLNIFDQRLLHDGTINYLSSLGIEVHARSIFLQGLLLMNSNKIPSYFQPWMHHLSKWHMFCVQESISPLRACLDFVSCLKDVSYVLVGIQDHSQLSEILDSSTHIAQLDFGKFSCDDPELLDPTYWKVT